MSITLVTGDDLLIAQTLKKNGATFDMTAATEVKSRLLVEKTKAPLTDAVVQTNTGSANWSASLVHHLFPSALTADLTYEGPVILETQVVLASKKTTWFATGLTMVRGTIA